MYYPGQAALSIQAYLTFCALTNQTPWTINFVSDEASVMEDEIPLDQIVVESIEPSDEEDEPETKHHKSISGKQLKVIRKTELSESEVKSACSICSDKPDPLLHIQQSVYDKGLEAHMKHVHKQITDIAKVKLEQHQIKLDNIPVPEPVKRDGQLRLVCTRADCQTTFGATKNEKYRLHMYHHEIVKPSKKAWPCDICDFASDLYTDWVNHKKKNHSKYIFKCRYPNCYYESHCYKYRQHHWQQTHQQPKEAGEPVCEVCGKRFRHMKTLKKHMHIHLGTVVNCSDCDKSFHSETQMRAHYRVHHTGFKFECFICPAKFIYKNQYESHMVHEHNQERQHACEYCGQRFIQKSHYNRHVKLYHRESEAKSSQKRRERGPNKGPLKKAFIPQGMANSTEND